MISKQLCKKKDHQQEINFICIKEDCWSNSTCCQLCINQNHNEHVENCIELSSISPNLKHEFKYDFGEQEAKDLLNNFIEQNQQKMLKLLEFLQIDIVLDVAEKSKNYIQNRQKQIKYLLDIKDYFNQQFEGLQKILFETKSQAKIILEKMITIEEELIKEKKMNIINVAQSEEAQSTQIQPIIQEMERGNEPKIIILDLYKDSSDEEYIEDPIDQIDLINCQDFQEEKECSYDLTQYKNLLRELQKSQQKYRDPSIEFETFYNTPKVKRISEITQGPINFFCNSSGKNCFASDGITVQFDDVIPFKQKNNFFFYLMYYLASFCPEQLKKVFITQQVNKYGIYALINFDSSENQHQKDFIQIIDDFVPAKSNIKLSKNNSICFILLQKSIAKTKQGYNFFDQIYYIDCVTTIFPYALIIILDFDEILEKIQREIASKSLIFIHNLKTHFSPPLEQRIYQILDIVEIKNLFDEQVVLFKLKSAYGRNVESGDWNFSSPLWTEDKKKELNISLEDDGIFYMDLGWFFQNHSSIYSFRVNQGTKVFQPLILRSTQASYFQLIVEKDDQLGFLIEYENQLENQNNLLKQKSFKVIIADAKSFTQVYSFFFSQILQFTAELKKGTYIIYIKHISLLQKEVIQANLRIVGFHSVNFEQIQKIDNYKYSVFSEQINKNGKVVKENKFLKALVLDQKSKGWFVYKFINISQQAIDVKFKCIFEFNLICKPYTNNAAFKKLGTNESMLIILKPLINDKYKINIQVNGEKYSF